MKSKKTLCSEKQTGCADWCCEHNSQGRHLLIRHEMTLNDPTTEVRTVAMLLVLVAEKLF